MAWISLPCPRPLSNCCTAFRDRTCTSPDFALQCDESPHGRMGNPAIAGDVSGRGTLSLCDPGSGHQVRPGSDNIPGGDRLKAKRTSVRAPWQNGLAERWVGSCRREILDDVNRSEREPSAQTDRCLHQLSPPGSYPRLAEEGYASTAACGVQAIGDCHGAFTASPADCIIDTRGGKPHRNRNKINRHVMPQHQSG